jgi:membrane-bound serine protease (ClpP class)
VVTIDTAIHPVAAEILADAVRAAEEAGADALVVELDTPGGLLTSTRDMIQTMLGSPVPVIVYVSPSGAQAASAGFFLLMASDVAAMAPGTNTGAAAAVNAEGGDIEGTMGKKVEQDGLAQIRSLAKRRGRNVELAQEAVTEARSYDAQEALEENLVELVSPSLAALLNDVDGRTVTNMAGEEATLRTAEATLERYEPSRFQRFRGFLAIPDLAMLLLGLGSVGLMMEIYNPGAIFPGVLGAICLVLGFYGMSVLPVNAAGLALLGLAAIFFIAEIKVTSYGLLTLAGVACLLIGGTMLFESADPALRVSWTALVSITVLAVAVVGFLATQALRARKNRVRTGSEGLVTERGRAWNDLAPHGKVFVHGEIWDAISEAPVAKGQPVEVTAVEGMVLRVRPLADPYSLPAPGAAS